MHLYVSRILVLCLLFSVASADKIDILDRDWTKVTSPNVTVYSTLGPEVAKQIAWNLERLRLASPGFTFLGDPGTGSRVTVFALASQFDFHRFDLKTRDHQTLVASTSGSVVFLHDFFEDRAVGMALHVYVHLLARAQGDYHFPMWLSEGLARYLHTAEVADDHFSIGFSNNSPLLRLADVDGVIDSSGFSSGNRNSRLTHLAFSDRIYRFLAFREDRSFADDVFRYSKLMEDQTPALEAFKNAYGISVEQMKTHFRRKPKRTMSNVYRFNLTAFPAAIEPTIESLSQLEVSLAVANAATQTGALQLAEHALTMATSHDLDDARIQLGFGRLYLEKALYAQAEEYFRRALSTVPDNVEGLLGLGLALQGRAERARDMDTRRNLIEASQENLTESLRLQPDNAEALAAIGNFHLSFSDKREEAIRKLESAARIRPESEEIRMMLAKAYCSHGQGRQANWLARQVLEWPHLAAEQKDVALGILDCELR